MDTLDFMDINGEEIFDTGEGYTFLGPEFNECFGMSYDDYYYEDEIEEEEEESQNLQEYVSKGSKFKYAELNREKMECSMPGCLSTVIKHGEPCYYCKKKKEGLI